jgi:hypothetical protein
MGLSAVLFIFYIVVLLYLKESFFEGNFTIECLKGRYARRELFKTEST